MTSTDESIDEHDPHDPLPSRSLCIQNSDKYFHARGNYDAARRGPGDVWAAKVISDAWERIQSFLSCGAEDTAANQFANEWGRCGKDPNHFRPPGLSHKY
ncbi:serum amyloid A-3 protein-like [Octodon degus]|uniref:Serum amyloid A protein n=1 Tax=Octodon degus TaxID=10160 RepID=A0A6P3VC37_OCTDE|nr:serum amyloid A-3 protein-like [Octodon degus]